MAVLVAASLVWPVLVVLLGLLLGRALRSADRRAGARQVTTRRTAARSVVTALRRRQDVPLPSRDEVSLAS